MRQMPPTTEIPAPLPQRKLNLRAGILVGLISGLAVPVWLMLVLPWLVTQWERPSLFGIGYRPLTAADPQVAQLFDPAYTIDPSDGTIVYLRPEEVVPVWLVCMPAMGCKPARNSSTNFLQFQRATDQIVIFFSHALLFSGVGAAASGWVWVQFRNVPRRERAGIVLVLTLSVLSQWLIFGLFIWPNNYDEALRAMGSIFGR